MTINESYDPIYDELTKYTKQLNEMKQDYRVKKLEQLTGFNFNTMTPAEPSPREKLKEKLANLANLKVDFLNIMLEAKKKELKEIQEKVQKKNKGKAKKSRRKLVDIIDLPNSNTTSTESQELLNGSGTDAKNELESNSSKLESNHIVFPKSESNPGTHFQYDKNVLNISLGKSANQKIKHYSIA